MSTTTNHSDEPFPEQESSDRLWSELVEAVRNDDGAWRGGRRNAAWLAH